jgi:hypothetical protein
MRTSLLNRILRFYFFNCLSYNIELLIMKQKITNQKISKKNNKILSCNFFIKPIFETEVFNDSIRNINKEKHNYYRIFDHLI